MTGAALGTLIARIFEFVFICMYLIFFDKKIGFRIHDIFMKCQNLMKEYVQISIPVVISDTLYGFGNSAVSMVMGRIGSQFVSANSITLVTQQLSTVFIQGQHSRAVLWLEIHWARERLHGQRKKQNVS